MFDKLVRESDGVYKAEYERDRLFRDWHPDPCWSWFVFTAGDSECNMWGFLPVNHWVQRRIWVSGTWQTMHWDRRGRHILVCQKTFDVFFKLSFSEACFKSVCSSWHSFIRVTSAVCGACPEGASLSEEKIMADATSLLGASSGWQPEMGRTGCCRGYKMLSCLWMVLACISVFSCTQSSAEWLLVLGGNGRGSVIPGSSLPLLRSTSIPNTYSHTVIWASKSGFNTSKVHRVTFRHIYISVLDK